MDQGELAPMGLAIALLFLFASAFVAIAVLAVVVAGVSWFKGK